MNHYFCVLNFSASYLHLPQFCFFFCLALFFFSTFLFFFFFYVSSLSICLSCFSDNSIGPIVTTMAIITLFIIIGTLDVSIFDNVRPFLFTTHMASWRSFFEDPLPINDIRNSVIILLVHNVVFVLISLIKFNKKDITT